MSHGLKLVKQGADILDIGGESTRPGSTPVDEAEEMRRVIPVIKCLASQVQIPISVDTRKPGVAFSALQAGASIINDVGANRSNIDMWNVVAESLAGYVCMHMQGIPQSMQREPAYLNVVNEVADFFESRIQLMKGSGIKGDHVVLDPGIGFGQSIEHNLELLADLELLVRLQRPILLGVSRKSFIGKLLGTDLAERLPSSLACATLAVE